MSQFMCEADMEVEELEMYGFQGREDDDFSDEEAQRLIEEKFFEKIHYGQLGNEQRGTEEILFEGDDASVTQSLDNRSLDESERQVDNHCNKSSNPRISDPSLSHLPANFSSSQEHTISESSSNSEAQHLGSSTSTSTSVPCGALQNLEILSIRKDGVDRYERAQSTFNFSSVSIDPRDEVLNFMFGEKEVSVYEASEDQLLLRKVPVGLNSVVVLGSCTNDSQKNLNRTTKEVVTVSESKPTSSKKREKTDDLEDPFRRGNIIQVNLSGCYGKTENKTKDTNMMEESDASEMGNNSVCNPHIANKIIEDKNKRNQGGSSAELLASDSQNLTDFEVVVDSDSDTGSSVMILGVNEEPDDQLHVHFADDNLYEDEIVFLGNTEKPSGSQTKSVGQQIKSVSSKTTTDELQTRTVHQTGRYFLKNQGDNVEGFCHNCSEYGHFHADCPLLQEEPVCIFCSAKGHMYSTCPQQLCYNCSRPGHQKKDCKEKKGARSGPESCSRCGLYGHSRQTCPDLWRQYHLTVEAGPIVSPRKTIIPPTKLYCYNCGKKGHFGHECFEERILPDIRLKKMYPALPYVVHYDKGRGKRKKTVQDDSPSTSIDSTKKARTENNKSSVNERTVGVSEDSVDVRRKVNNNESTQSEEPMEVSESASSRFKPDGKLSQKMVEIMRKNITFLSGLKPSSHTSPSTRSKNPASRQVGGSFLNSEINQKSHTSPSTRADTVSRDSTRESDPSADIIILDRNHLSSKVKNVISSNASCTSSERLQLFGENLLRSLESGWDDFMHSFSQFVTQEELEWVQTVEFTINMCNWLLKKPLFVTKEEESKELNMHVVEASAGDHAEEGIHRKLNAAKGRALYQLIWKHPELVKICPKKPNSERMQLQLLCLSRQLGFPQIQCRRCSTVGVPNAMEYKCTVSVDNLSTSTCYSLVDKTNRIKAAITRMVDILSNDGRRLPWRVQKPSKAELKRTVTAKVFERLSEKLQSDNPLIRVVHAEPVLNTLGEQTESHYNVYTQFTCAGFMVAAVSNSVKASKNVALNTMARLIKAHQPQLDKAKQVVIQSNSQWTIAEFEAKYYGMSPFKKLWEYCKLKSWTLNLMTLDDLETEKDKMWERKRVVLSCSNMVTLGQASSVAEARDVAVVKMLEKLGIVPFILPKTKNIKSNLQPYYQIQHEWDSVSFLFKACFELGKSSPVFTNIGQKSVIDCTGDEVDVKDFTSMQVTCGNENSVARSETVSDAKQKAAESMLQLVIDGIQPLDPELVANEVPMIDLTEEGDVELLGCQMDPSASVELDTSLEISLIEEGPHSNKKLDDDVKSCQSTRELPSEPSTSGVKTDNKNDTFGGLKMSAAIKKLLSRTTGPIRKAHGTADSQHSTRVGREKSSPVEPGGKEIVAKGSTGCGPQGGGCNTTGSARTEAAQGSKGTHECNISDDEKAQVQTLRQHLLKPPNDELVPHLFLSFQLAYVNQPVFEVTSVKSVDAEESNSSFLIKNKLSGLGFEASSVEYHLSDSRHNAAKLLVKQILKAPVHSLEKAVHEENKRRSTSNAKDTLEGRGGLSADTREVSSASTSVGVSESGEDVNSLRKESNEKDDESLSPIFHDLVQKCIEADCYKPFAQLNILCLIFKNEKPVVKYDTRETGEVTAQVTCKDVIIRAAGASRKDVQRKVLIRAINHFGFISQNRQDRRDQNKKGTSNQNKGQPNSAERNKDLADAVVRFFQVCQIGQITRWITNPTVTVCFNNDRLCIVLVQWKGYSAAGAATDLPRAKEIAVENLLREMVSPDPFYVKYNLSSTNYVDYLKNVHHLKPSSKTVLSCSSKDFYKQVTKDISGETSRNQVNERMKVVRRQAGKGRQVVISNNVEVPV